MLEVDKNHISTTSEISDLKSHKWKKNNVFDDVESARMNEFAWGMADLNKLLQSKISLGDWIGDLSKRIFEPTTHWIMNIQ